MGLKVLPGDPDRADLGGPAAFLGDFAQQSFGADNAIGFVSGQVEVPASDLGFYDFDGRRQPGRITSMAF